MRPAHLIVALAVNFLAQSIMAQGVDADSSRPWRDPVYEVDVTEHIYGYGGVAPSPATIPLYLDLYVPSGQTVPGRRRPAILLIHGGGFVGGSRKFPPLVRMATELSKRGYVVVSIDYRVSGDSPVLSERVQALPVNNYPLELLMNAVIEDALTALDWLLDNSSPLKLDATRLGVMGSSAGAVTAIHLAYTAKDYGIDVPAFRFVVDFFGSAIIPLGDPVAAVNHLENGEPPLFIVHGIDDQTAPIERSDALASRAYEQNVPVEYHAIEGAGHGFYPFEPNGVDLDMELGESGLTILDRMIEWIHAAVFKPGCLSHSQGTGQGNTCTF